MPAVIWRPASGVLGASLFRTPGYPTFVWLLGGNATIGLVIAAQCLMGGLLNPILTHRLASRVADARVATVATWVVAIDPATVGHDLLVATETLTTTCLLVGLLVLARCWARVRRQEAVPVSWAIGLGLLLAAGALVRPAMVTLIPTVAVLLAVGGRSRRALASAALVALVAAVPVSAWYVRNVRVADVHAFATVSDQNALDYGVTAAVVDHDGWSVLGHPDRLARLQREELATGVGGPQRTEHGLDGPKGTSAGTRLIRDHPVGAIVVAAWGLGRTVLAGGAPLFEAHLPSGVWRALSVPAKVTTTAWAVLLDVAMVVGAAVAFRDRSGRLLAVTATPIVVVLVTAFGPGEYLRFRVPVVPCIGILAGVAVSTFKDRRRAAAHRG
jgi:hypothetical protein